MNPENTPQNCITIPLHRPDLKEKLFFILSGMVMSVPFALLVGSIATNFLNLTFSAFITQTFAIVIIAPLLEEFAKAYPIFYRHGETERSLLSLGFFTGLGFGIVEFIFYVFIFHAPVVPRLVAILFHASSTSIVSYGVAKKSSFFFYLIAVILHFSNNFVAVLNFPWIYISIAVVATTFFLAIILRFKASPEKMIGY